MLVEQTLSRQVLINDAESLMLDMPQVDCSVVHHFGPGIYIREVTLPAGTLAIGHHQKYPHLNIMLSGVVNVLDDHGSLKTLRAPLIFTGDPGRKFGLVVETCVWQNVYPNPDNCRDIDALEAKWLDKSQAWESHNLTSIERSNESHNEDRSDFMRVIEQAGFTEEQVQSQSENPSDQIPMPNGFPFVTVRKSQISGVGVFLSHPVSRNDLIGPARIDGMRTPLGRFTNHSRNPNSMFVKSENGDIYLYALRDISGCKGGNQGEEVTVDYRHALSLSGIHISKDES